jgi:hypothetical protein
MSSNELPDRRPIEWRVPTTAEDVAALKRLRAVVRPWPLDALNRLNPPALFPVSRDRRTSAGAEPFRL